MNGIGALSFTKADGKNGKIFLRQGNVYAVDNLEYESHLWNELRFEELLSHSNIRPLIRSNKSQRDSLYKILRKNRNKQDNENIINVLKEYVLGALDDIYMWDQVQVEWRVGDKFPYEAGHIPDLPLSRLMTIVVNRTYYKFQRYETWGFKNDEQFAYGQVAIDLGSAKKSHYAPKTGLEGLILEAKKFVIKELSEGSGYSLFTIIAALDELSENYEITIENPYGRHIPTPPPLPQGMQVVGSQVSFTDRDSEINNDVFTREYVAPEAAKLQDEETFHHFSAEEIEPPKNEVEETYTEAFNDTTDEAADALPDLESPKLSDYPSRMTIPEEDLEKEYSSQEYLEDLYNSDTKNTDANDNNVSEAVEIKDSTLTNLPTDEKETTMTDNNANDNLLDLVNQLQVSLQNKKSVIESAQDRVTVKEQELREARAVTQRIEEELGKAVLEKETASSDYNQALSVINNLK